MIKLLEYITRSLTDNKKIKVSESVEEGVNIYTICAPQEVMGLLIGKAGKTIRAIRQLARARAIVDQININVKLEEA